MKCNIIFCHFRPIFALLPHYWPQKLTFEKNVKNTWRYYPFTHVYHKSRSYDVWFLRYKVQRTEFFVILGHFWPLTLLTTQKSKFWKNKKKWLVILSFYTSVPQMMIMWCMVPEVWSTTDRIFCHFRLFFDLLPPSSPKNKNFKIMKKIIRDIIILHKCTKNHNHMLYCSWYMVCDRSNWYSSFWTIFCPFTPITAQKIKIKKMKKGLEISSFYTIVATVMIICYTVLDIWHMTDMIVIFHFGLFFALLPP